MRQVKFLLMAVIKAALTAYGVKSGDDLPCFGNYEFPVLTLGVHSSALMGQGRVVPIHLNVF
ncbi:MAG TPA: hypothetical protein DIS88_08145 [Prevotella sp.]|jgi:hypothetical protein|nr:hypothetical protein [Prevotella sp.]